MAVRPPGDQMRLNKPRPVGAAMRISAWPSIRPATPFSACALACATRAGVRNHLKSRARIVTITAAPTTSATANCQPRKTIMTIVNSSTRFVEAISNVIAAVKSAPFRKIDRAIATAAYEQDDEAAPSPHARRSVRGRWSPNMRTMASLDTTAWMAAEIPKPRINGHRICQNMANDIQRACSTAKTRVMCQLPPVVLGEYAVRAGILTTAPANPVYALTRIGQHSHPARSDANAGCLTRSAGPGTFRGKDRNRTTGGSGRSFRRKRIAQKPESCVGGVHRRLLAALAGLR